jgi:hypothetical protein
MFGAADRFSHILKNFPTTVINFHLGGLPVTPRGFSDVGDEIQAGHIRLLRSRSLPAGVEAEYRWTRDTLVVRDNLSQVLNTISGRSAVVHEGVHAMIDRNRAVATTILTAEAAGYLAQITYRLRSGDRLRPWIEANRSTQDGEVYYEALQLIDRFGLLTGQATMQWVDTAALRAAINRHSRYRDVSATDLHGADGVG